jgi:hypothetical protein
MNKLCAKLFKCFNSRDHPVVPADSPHNPQTLLPDASLVEDSKLNDGSKVRQRYKPKSKVEAKPTLDYEMPDQAEIRQQTLMNERQPMDSPITSSFDILESERSISLTI